MPVATGRCIVASPRAESGSKPRMAFDTVEELISQRLASRHIELRCLRVWSCFCLRVFLSFQFFIGFHRGHVHDGRQERVPHLHLGSAAQHIIVSPARACSLVKPLAQATLAVSFHYFDDFSDFVFILNRGGANHSDPVISLNSTAFGAPIIYGVLFLDCSLTHSHSRGKLD